MARAGDVVTVEILLTSYIHTYVRMSFGQNMCFTITEPK